MTVLGLDIAKGISPQTDNFKLQDGFLTKCENSILDSGSMVPLKDLTEATDLPSYKTLALNAGYSVVKGPIFDDFFDRYYFTTGVAGDTMKVFISKPTDLIVNPFYNTPLTGASVTNPTSVLDGDELEWEGTDLSPGTIICADSLGNPNGVIILDSTTLRIDDGSSFVDLTINTVGTHKYLLQISNGGDCLLYVDGILVDSAPESLASPITSSVDSYISGLTVWRNGGFFTSSEISDAHSSGVNVYTDMVDASNIFDDNSDTYSTSNEGSYLTYDFGSAVELDNIGLQFWSAQYSATKIELYYSDDNQAFALSNSFIMLRSSSLQTRDVSELSGHRYWKVVVDTGDARFTKIEYYNDQNKTEETRDVNIPIPDEPTLTQEAVSGLGTISLSVGASAATLSKQEVVGNQIRGTFVGAQTGDLDATLGSLVETSVPLGQQYPTGTTSNITYNGDNVGTFKLVSIIQEFVAGVDYSGTNQKNYLVTYEYELFNSSSLDLTRQYLMAYKDDLGQVGPPSLPIEYNTAGASEITLAKLTFSAPSDPNVTNFVFYRSGPDGNYYEAGEADATATSWVDIYSEEDYRRLVPGERLDEFGNPPDSLDNLVSMAGGAVAATDNKQTVYLSKPLFPHIMPYSRTVRSQIVGMASTGSELVVCTTSNPELITGSHPTVMTQEIIMTNQACVSKESITQVKNSIIYAGTDGLVSVVGARGELITDGLIDQDEWESYNPQTMIGENHDGKYYGFTDNVSLVYDYEAGSLTTTTISPDSAFSDIETDTLYLRINDVDYKFDSGSNLTQTIISKYYRFPVPVTFSAMRVVAESYNDTVLNVYVNGSLASSVTPHSQDSRRLPKMPQAREIFFEVIGTDVINSVEIATSMVELRGQ